MVNRQPNTRDVDKADERATQHLSILYQYSNHLLTQWSPRLKRWPRLLLAQLSSSRCGVALPSTVNRISTDDISQKYTVQPTGIYARINNFFAVDPKRSSGVPLNPQFRVPTPGGLDPKLYDDPVTVPAADIAENPYWKRDTRRSYPQLSVVKQSDVVALLTVGNAAKPKELQIGDAGSKQLVAAKEEGEKGLSAFFQKEKTAFANVMGPNGLPPLPTSHYPGAAPKRYEMTEEQTYEGKYVYL